MKQARLQQWIVGGIITLIAINIVYTIITTHIKRLKHERIVKEGAAANPYRPARTSGPAGH
ncbi:hypothetical protein PV783_34070 [Chitinophaga sp. CC14]|uniref:hypothetical protein n=1 Tax=Chitinophaga sp. CC14 TaxID=3029199 RepID=UPI003B79DA71